MNTLITYLIIINIIGIASMGIDKSKAKNHRYRISERTFIFLSLIGGSLGVFLGIYFFHHKTKHPKFTVGIHVILFVQIAAAIFIYISLQ